jgi:hypothetical protein
VTARLHALGDNGVGPGGSGSERLLGRADLVEPRPRVSAARPAPEGDEHICPLRGLEVRPPRQGKKQVHGDRPVGEPPGRGDLGLELIGAEDPDRAESAGLGDGGGQLRSGEAAAHSGLHDRNLQSDPLHQVGHGPQYRADWPVGQLDRLPPWT